MKKPAIHLFTICWNEEAMLSFFFRHYDDIVDKYIFFDDGSDDKTLQILDQHPRVEVRSLPRIEVDSYVLSAQKIHDNCWKESRGKTDWVILSPVDELLFHPRLIEYINSCDSAGVSAIPALGYQMLSEAFPSEDSDLIKDIRSGTPWNNMNKLSLFKPDLIEETNFQTGRHSAKPTGNVIYPETDELLNLHYKYLSFETTFNRHQELDRKLGKFDKQNNWGHKYSWDREKLLRDWAYFKNRLVDQVAVDSPLNRSAHSTMGERWWRGKELPPI